MKKLIFLFVFGFILSSFVVPTRGEANPKNDTEQVSSVDYISSDFCKGFSEGYKQGACYEKGYGCITPIPPPCPVPGIGENTYKHGYNNGFAKGYKDYKNK